MIGLQANQSKKVVLVYFDIISPGKLDEAAQEADGDNAGKRSQLLTFMPAQRMHSAFGPKPALRTLLTGLPNGAGFSWMLVTKIVARRDRLASIYCREGSG